MNSITDAHEQKNLAKKVVRATKKILPVGATDVPAVHSDISTERTIPARR